MAEDIGSIVEKIMKNPEFVGLVNELRGSDGGTDAAAARLPEMLREFAPMLASEPEDGNRKTAEKAAEGDGEETLPASLAGKSFNRENARRLLNALRPYLGERRRGMIDQCVSVLQITDLIGAAGLAGGAGSP
ncbi:MAG: hypothetical protein IKQ92_13445 [Clostridia bacterium]|nr:hypothetical protein [Clostridia bacterium]